jgi:DNA processing protein
MLTMREVLVYFSLKYQGDWLQIRNAIANREKVTDEEAQEVLKKVTSLTMTLIDDNYPFYLKQAYRPPFVLFYKGEINLLSSPYKLGVIGSRNNTEYGAKCIEKLLGELNAAQSGITVISGMARGIDSLAEREAIQLGMNVVSVLGSGVDICYPDSSSDVYGFSSNSPKGLLISEYPDGVQPLAEHFPARNRIIASLIDSLLIVEAAEKSGTSITAKLALEENKDILCVPSSILGENQFTNELIKDGAIMCMDGKDLFDSLSRENRNLK